MKFTPKNLSVIAALSLAVLSPASSQTPSNAPAASTRARTAADSLTLTIDPAQSTVHWTLDTTIHTVHGTFRVKRGTITIDRSTGAASGEIIIDATSGASDNDSRDRKMHKDILESPKFSEIVFHPSHIDGRVPAQGPTKAQLHGIFTLHGSDHEFTAPTEAQLSGTQWRATSNFAIPYIDWHLKDPSTFLLKAKPTVEVKVDLAGTIN
jgi:polyisoprenoid-binding protein YceI